jgi:phosphatidylglycerol:prolipoprotein diacylglycerol transferase
VLSHLDEIDSPIDVIAIWEGGIQFSGGFIAAIIVGFPTFRTWGTKLRWRSLDGYALGLTIGLAIGRIGCYSVGEHFGRTTEFFLGTTYEGGSTQEDFIGDERLVEGMTFHNTSLYELLHLLVLFGLMLLLRSRARARGRELQPGTLMALFVLWYGVARFLTDFVRVNDSTVLGLTGAQWMTLVLIPVGIWVFVKVRPRAAAAPEDDEQIAAMQARVLVRADGDEDHD